MEIITTMIRDMVIIGIIASFCDLLLPHSDVKRPVRLVFGLYVMALMLNPLVSLLHDTELASIDFASLGEQQVINTEAQYSEVMVYKEAAATLSAEIEGKLNAVYYGVEADVSIEMAEAGFQSVDISMKNSRGNSAVITAEVKDLLSADYGIPPNVVNITF